MCLVFDIKIVREERVHAMHSVDHIRVVLVDEEWPQHFFVKLCELESETTFGKTPPAALRFIFCRRLFGTFKVGMLNV
jgi:hypothetical protein